MLPANVTKKKLKKDFRTRSIPSARQVWEEGRVLATVVGGQSMVSKLQAGDREHGGPLRGRPLRVRVRHRNYCQGCCAVEESHRARNMAFGTGRDDICPCQSNGGREGDRCTCGSWVRITTSVVVLGTVRSSRHSSWGGRGRQGGPFHEQVLLN